MDTWPEDEARIAARDIIEDMPYHDAAWVINEVSRLRGDADRIFSNDRSDIARFVQAFNACMLDNNSTLRMQGV
jgi:hypothetical protein